jgi:hypothetical protein
MRRFPVSVFLLGGLSFALAALPVCAQKQDSGQIEFTIVDVKKDVLRDFALMVRRLDEEKRVDWTKPFSIEVEGVLTKEGRLAQAKIIKTDGDKELIEIAQQGISAIGDSGSLRYLSKTGVEKISFIAAQTSDTFSFSAVLELPAAEKARTVSSGLSALISFALSADKNGSRKLGDDEKTLLTNARVTSAEKAVNINISMPAGEFREMMRRQFNASEEKTNG